MGVYHFMGLGTSTGVVTCAVDYIEKALDINEGKRTGDKQAVSNLFRGTGGITHPEDRKGKIEAIVLFASKEVINRTKPEGASRMTTDEVRDDLLKQLKKVWKTPISEGRKVFWCEVDVDDLFPRLFGKNGQSGLSLQKTYGPWQRNLVQLDWWNKCR